MFAFFPPYFISSYSSSMNWVRVLNWSWYPAIMIFCWMNWSSHLQTMFQPPLRSQWEPTEITRNILPRNFACRVFTKPLSYDNGISRRPTPDKSMIMSHDSMTPGSISFLTTQSKKNIENYRSWSILTPEVISFLTFTKIMGWLPFALPPIYMAPVSKNSLNL